MLYPVVLPVTLAVTRQINEHQPRLVRQRRDLLAPETEIASPAMDENNGVLSLARGDIVNFVCAEGDKMRLERPVAIGR